MGMVSPLWVGRNLDAFAVVRTFEGRLTMLRKVSNAYFMCCNDHGAEQKQERDKLFEELKTFLKTKCKNAGERRNDIAHGVLQETNHFNPPKRGYCWGPSCVDSTKIDFAGKPSFAYSSKELEGYSSLFHALTKEGIEIRNAILAMPSPYPQTPP